MPTLEPDISEGTEGTRESNNYDHNDYNVEISVMDPRSDVSLSAPTSSPANNHNRFEDQQSLLKCKGLGNYAIDFILSK
ncbi:hypothetical protein AYI68_g3593 [Smittium mucronatum]|uniref:Uncharacterized protein n=1 Tax=Smittium mucronatum TaxID=133383 RepID=A0A1R0GZG7_9FUNG|nr:hypothetical protein AYI68_g3593 [Smittium mucronatum]